MGGTCGHEGELLAMKGKIVEFWLKPVGGSCMKNAGKSRTGTCAHEGELVPMKGKNCGFLVEAEGGTLRKRPENNE